MTTRQPNDENTAIIRTLRAAARLMDVNTVTGRTSAGWFTAAADAREKGEPLFDEDIWLPLAEMAVHMLGDH